MHNGGFQEKNVQLKAKKWEDKAEIVFESINTYNFKEIDLLEPAV